MASSSAKALPGREGQGGQREGRGGFNGLLIGQGTAGCANEPECSGQAKSFNGLLIGQGTAGMRSCSQGPWRCGFQWPPHRPRHCRVEGSCRSMATARWVSMASSSAKALPEGLTATTSTCAGGVSMASSSAKALPVRSTPRQIILRWSRFQWPPHRPRHCRSDREEVVLTGPSFNGLLIGQGTAGLRALHFWNTEITVSMASSSAKALPAYVFGWFPVFRLRFNGLLIGQGTAGGKRFHSRGSGSAFQWPPHRPRHCRRNCWWYSHTSVFVSMASSSAKALPVDALVRGAIGIATVSMASSSAKALPDYGCCSTDRAVCVSMASSSAKALPEGRRELPGVAGEFQWPPHRPRHCRGATGNRRGRERLFQWPPHRPRHCRWGTDNGYSSCCLVSMASSSAKALPGAFGKSQMFRRRFQWPPHRPRHCRDGEALRLEGVSAVSMASSSAKALPGGCRW